MRTQDWCSAYRGHLCNPHSKSKGRRMTGLKLRTFSQQPVITIPIVTLQDLAKYNGTAKTEQVRAMSPCWFFSPSSSWSSSFVVCHRTFSLRYHPYRTLLSHVIQKRPSRSFQQSSHYAYAQASQNRRWHGRLGGEVGEAHQGLESHCACNFLRLSPSFFINASLDRAAPHGHNTQNHSAHFSPIKRYPHNSKPCSRWSTVP